MSRLSGMMVAAAFLVSLGLLAACEGDSGGGGGGNEAEVGQTFTATLTPETGGTLQTASGAAKLEIPAGALAEDEELTVTVAAKTSDTASEIYDFGPDGLEFETPVTLSIAYGGDPGEGKRAVIGWKDEERWTPLAGSTVAGGRVTAPITHFSQFAIVITSAGVSGEAACDDLGAGFSACGGDLTGTWEIQTLCMWFDPSDGPFGEDQGPFEGCEGLEYGMSVDWSGLYTFDGTDISMSVEQTVVNSTLSVPTSCFPEGMTCDMIAQSMDTMTCAESGGTCSCTGQKIDDDPDDNEPSAYTIEGGNVLVIGDDESGGEQRFEFCVEGDTLTLHGVATEPRESGTTDWVVLKKQD